MELADESLVEFINDEGWMTNLVTDHNGKTRLFQKNAELFLDHDPRYAGAIGIDSMDGSLRLTRPIPAGKSAGDRFDNFMMSALRVEIEGRLGISMTDRMLDAAVTAVANRNRFHSGQDYLTALEWDGQGRLDSFLSTYLGCPNSAYARTIGRKFLISAVARMMNPGCKVDTVLVLEGPQGSKKSQAIRALSPKREWVLDTPQDLYTKDANLSLAGRWLVEFAELDTLSRAASSRIKAFITLTHDEFRPPYETVMKSFPRTTVFVGTTNDASYLNDETGARRFWPVKIGTVRLDQITADRGQIWAEAVTAYTNGEAWHLSSAEEALALEEQAQRRDADPWEARIAEFVNFRSMVTVLDVLTHCLAIQAAKANSKDGRRVSRILSNVLGWEKGRVARGGHKVQAFLPPSGQWNADPASATGDMNEAVELDEDDDLELPESLT
ncbi:MAG: hypothetical protein JST38_13005 [Bacteroidetes bacterium]|nr:hypothetical protein [Bacteroidota bacterium]